MNYKYFPNNFMLKLYRCDAKEVTLFCDTNYLKDILLLASSALTLSLNNYVLGENGEQIYVEDFIDNFPLLQCFVTLWNNGNHRPCKSFEKLFISLQTRATFEELSLSCLPDEFNIEAVLEILKFQTCFIFSENILPETDNRLKKIVEEIIDTEYFDFCPPYIWFKTLKNGIIHN